MKKNVTDVGDGFLEIEDDFKNKRIGLVEAKFRSSNLWKRVATAIVQMKYNKRTGNSHKQIKFLVGE